MGENPLPRLKKYRISLDWFRKNKKRNILIGIILASAASLFFSAFFRVAALAENNIVTLLPSPETLDPLERISQGSLEKLSGHEKDNRSCEVRLLTMAAEPNPLEIDYKEMLSGHPMEEMAAELAQKDRIVAAFLIGIAKKESNWGIHSPKKDGHDCYNYWGYRGRYNATASGYSCFDTPQQAVDVVGTRIQDLIAQRIDTPARMVVWKCGSAACQGFDQADVQKWIADVSIYYYRAKS